MMDSKEEMENIFPTCQGYDATNSGDMTLAPTP